MLFCGRWWDMLNSKLAYVCSKGSALKTPMSLTVSAFKYPAPLLNSMIVSPTFDLNPPDCSTDWHTRLTPPVVCMTTYRAAESEGPVAAGIYTHQLRRDLHAAGHGCHGVQHRHNPIHPVMTIHGYVALLGWVWFVVARWCGECGVYDDDGKIGWSNVLVGCV